jgi:DNA processing protein
MAFSCVQSATESNNLQHMIETQSSPLHDHLALALVPELGPRRTAMLLAHFGSPAAVRRATVSQLQEVPGIGSVLAERFVRALPQIDLKSELQLLDKHGVSLIPLGSPNYPVTLARIDDPPPLLYFRGSLADTDRRAVAIVGSRHCTGYGKRVAERLAGGLARAGITVISGLARGIDGAAHRGALDAGGRTIAVLAGGLSRIYPPEHADLAGAIERNGCLLTETPMTVQPQPGMFPARNRIITGLSQAVVIVEAGERSGALISAQHAAEQGREVFAVPGQVDSPASNGTLQLLREGARLIRSVDDILEDLAGIAPVAADLFTTPRPTESTTTVAPAAPAPQLDETQRRIWDVLGEGPVAVDQIGDRTGIDAAALNVQLMLLEMKKIVRRLPGNVYERR